MAIKKSVELENGVIAEYWRIENVVLINGSNQAEVLLELWKDKSVRQNSSKTSVKKELYFVELESLNCDIFPTCYSKIKLLENFTGAEDV